LFLGPKDGEGPGKLEWKGEATERRPLGLRDQVQFRWEITVPDAPPGFGQPETVEARADNVLDRGVPLPPDWNPLLRYRALLRRALQAARSSSPGFECRLQGIWRPLPSPPQLRPPAPQTGGIWRVREEGGVVVEVWIAAHHAGDEWWCVKAPKCCRKFRLGSAKRCSISLPIYSSAVPSFSLQLSDVICVGRRPCARVSKMIPKGKLRTSQGNRSLANHVLWGRL